MMQPAGQSSDVAGERSAMLADLRQVVDEAMEAHREQLQSLLDELRIEMRLRGSPQGAEPSELRTGHVMGRGQPAEASQTPPQLDERKVAMPGLDADLVDMAQLESQKTTLTPKARMSLNLSACEPRRVSTASDTYISKRALRRAFSNDTCLQRFVHSVVFENLSGGLICINAIIIGMHANERSMHPGICNAMWAHVFLLFNCTFLLELAFRLAVSGKMFFCGFDWRWNLFDMFIVVAGFVEDIIGYALSSSGCGMDDVVTSNPLSSSITVLRILRIARVVRMVKAFRTMTIFRDLRLMVYSTINCLMPLVWACILLGFIHWCFSVYFLHLAADHVTQLMVKEGPAAMDRSDVKEVRIWFGSLWLAMNTLFMTITGGTNWENPSGALHNISGEYSATILFMVFISLTTFAVLNVITGVFVENATSWAKKDRDVVIQATLQSRNRFVRDLMAVFTEADEDNSGQLTFAELEQHIEDPRVEAFLEFLELDGLGAQKMFSLFDYDGSGTVSLEEFVTGCLELRGDAKAVDIAALKLDVRRSFRTLSTSIRSLERPQIREQDIYVNV